MQVKVQRKALEATDICSFELVPTEAGPLPRYEPGAHIDVEVGSGQIRQYSLCTPYNDDCYVIGVKRDPRSRGGSMFMHGEVKEGDVLLIGQPRNHFPLAEDGERFILVAGGIGITPLLAMATHLGSAGKTFELHYFAQSAEHVAFRQRLQDTALAFRVNYHHGYGPDALPELLASIVGASAPRKYLYLCGPRPFMELVRQSAASWPADQVRFEYFGAGSTPVPAPAPEVSFEVCAAASGISAQVQAGESIVNVLRANGVHIETSCEEGHCGTCMTEVLEGQPEHRDSFLTADEKAAGNRILPCVSRSCSARLILNL
jgi:vanillate O-demethylase ferredoxin subunit